MPLKDCKLVVLWCYLEKYRDCEQFLDVPETVMIYLFHFNLSGSLSYTDG